MIGASVADDASSALVTPPELTREGNFSDLAWQGDAGDYSFGLGLEWPSGPVREAHYTLDGGSGRPPYVKELVVRGEDRQIIWSGQAPPGPGRAMRSDTDETELSFVGLVPQTSQVHADRKSVV